MNTMTVVLEPSTNSHIMEANHVDVVDYKNSMLKLNIQGSGVIKHGEHGTIKTESPTVFKYVQQELNPITKKMQKATD